MIEHEGVKYRKVEREARDGEVIQMVEDDWCGDYYEDDVFTAVGSEFFDNKNDPRDLSDHKYVVLEPVPPAMPKLTDANPGDIVRITNANDVAKAGYKTGDQFRISSTWRNARGVTTTSGNELYAEEFEVVSPHSDSFGEQLAQSLEQAAQMADNIKKPAHYTQGGVETIEYIEQVTAGYTDGFVAHCVGTAVKYVSRAPHKHDTPTDDLRKAREYLNFAIARLEQV